MKKFLDLSLTQRGSPQQRQAEEKSFSKIIKKLSSGLRADHYPYISFYFTHEQALQSLLFCLFQKESLKTGKNQFLFESGSTRGALEFAKASKSMNMISTLIPYEKTGQVSYDHLKSKLGPKSLIFSSRLIHPVMATCDENFSRLTHLLHESSIYHHLDISYALGSSFSDLSLFDADFLSYKLPSHSSVQGALIFSKMPLSSSIIPSRQLESSQLDELVTFFEKLYEEGSSMLLQSLSLKMHLVQKLKKELPEVEMVFEPHVQTHHGLCLHLKGIHQDALNFVMQSHGASVELGGGGELEISALLESAGFEASFAKSCFSLNLESLKDQSQLDEFVLILKNAHQILSQGALA